MNSGSRKDDAKWNHLVRVVYALCAFGLPGACALPLENVTDPLYNTLLWNCALYSDCNRTSAASVASRSPDSLSELQLWLRAEAITGLADGASVSVWGDSSSNAYSANSVDAGCDIDPTYRTAAMNGRPVVRFSGQDQECLTLGSNYIFSASDGMTIVAAVSSTETDDSEPDFVFDFGFHANTGIGFYYNSSIAVFYTPGIFGGILPTLKFSRAAGTVTVLVARAAVGGSHLLRLDGSQSFTASTTLQGLSSVEITENPTRAVGSGPITIGGQSKTAVETGRFFKGDLGEIAVFNRVLSDAELAGLECYLGVRYGVRLPYGCY